MAKNPTTQAEAAKLAQQILTTLREEAALPKDASSAVVTKLSKGTARPPSAILEEQKKIIESKDQELEKSEIEAKELKLKLTQMQNDKALKNKKGVKRTHSDSGLDRARRPSVSNNNDDDNDDNDSFDSKRSYKGPSHKFN